MDYLPYQKLATKMIRDYGRDVIYREVPHVILDPHKPHEVTPGTPIEITVKAVFVDKYRENAFAAYIPNSDFSKGSTYVLIEKGSFTPNISGQLIDGNVKWGIRSQVEKKPGDTGLLFILEVFK